MWHNSFKEKGGPWEEIWLKGLAVWGLFEDRHERQPLKKNSLYTQNGLYTGIHLARDYILILKPVCTDPSISLWEHGVTEVDIQRRTKSSLAPRPNFPFHTELNRTSIHTNALQHSSTAWGARFAHAIPLDTVTPRDNDCTTINLLSLTWTEALH